MTVDNPTPRPESLPVLGLNTTEHFLPAKVSGGKTIITVKLSEESLHAALGLLDGFKLTAAIVQPGSDPGSEGFELFTTWVIHDNKPHLLYRKLEAIAEEALTNEQGGSQ